MTVVEVLILLAIAAICGFLAQMIAGYARGGLIVATILGFIGALLGSWLSREMNLPELFSIEVGGKSFPIIWSIIGATLFMLIIGILTRRR